MPGPRERLLPIRNDRTVNFHNEVAPRPTWRTADTEFVREANAAHECGCAIHEQQLAMIAQKVVQPLSEVHDVIYAQLDACIGQAAAIRMAERQRAETIQNDSHPDSAPGRSDEGFDETPGDHSGLHEIHFHQNIGSSVIDRPDQTFKILLGGLQQQEPIAVAPRPVGGGRIGALFRRLSHALTMNEPRTARPEA